jgi:hypothetical protein
MYPLKMIWQRNTYWEIPIEMRYFLSYPDEIKTIYKLANRQWWSNKDSIEIYVVSESMCHNLNGFTSSKQQKGKSIYTFSLCKLYFC